MSANIHTSKLNVSANLTDANLANKSGNGVSDVLMGSNQNVGIDISGRLSSIPPQRESHGRHSNAGGDRSQITEKAQADPIFDDVDDGIKSARLSIGGGEEYEEEDHYEGDMNLEQDRSRHLGAEELAQPSMESPDAQHNDSLLKPEKSADNRDS